MIRILELFGGIGACTKALERLGFPHEIADYVEIDKYAVKSFNAIHNTNYEPQDICEWNKDIPVDFIMHGSPCQDFSIAGKQAGGDEGSGTRSSLLDETLRIVEKTRPKVVLWENVKNLLSAKHKPNWERYCKRMEELGYRNYAKVLNAKDYGIPQNRERVYTMSIRNDIPGPFKFPEPEPLTKKLKDVLEDSVDEKYYLSDEQMASFKASTEKQRAKGYGFAFKPRSTETYAYTISTRAGQRKTDNFVKIFGNLNQPGWRKENGAVLSGDEISPTIMAQSNNAIKKVAIRTANKLGFDLATDGDGIDLAYPQSTTRRGRVGHGVAKTLATSDSQGTLDGFRIRKLTPKECWRLMGFDDADFEKAEKVNSNTQLYKQAGNSIVVNVLEKILANLPDGAK
jgi:DNA (cytosine-5)-methyltransferase 1